MSTDKNVQLTEPAEKRLETVLESYRYEILEVIAHENFVPGEEVTEATAADIENAIYRLRFGTTNRVEIAKLYAFATAMMGILVTLLSSVWSFFSKLVYSEYIIMALGVYISLLGFMLYWRLSISPSKRRGHIPNSSERIAHLERQLKVLLHEVRSEQDPLKYQEKRTMIAPLGDELKVLVKKVPEPPPNIQGESEP